MTRSYYFVTGSFEILDAIKQLVVIEVRRFKDPSTRIDTRQTFVSMRPSNPHLLIPY